MKRAVMSLSLLTVVIMALSSVTAHAQSDKPNIVIIMGDDVGIWNIGAYHRGAMAGKTPNLDKLANEGMLFTDYYAEASCTAGRAAFITGQLPIRTGMTTVGQAGAKMGIPTQASTIAGALKSLGYATGQFGKNHLGDWNEFLPTVHGFDEFHGYLYHLNAMEDPYTLNYPKDPAFRAKYGPRDVIHSWASDNDAATEEPRWGKVGKQKIQNDGPLPPHPGVDPNAKLDMETVDDVFMKTAFDFMDKAKKERKPFFVWHNPTRMHVWTHLSPKYRAMQNAETGYGLYEAGMAQLDDIVGAFMKKLDEMGEAQNTLFVFTTDNGAEVFTWPDGGMTPYRGTKGMSTEGGFRAPAIVRWPGKIKPGRVENGIFSGQDWYPTLVAAAGNPNIKEQLLKGAQLGDRSFKNHLDGYNQLDLLLGKAPSARHEVFYFAGPHLGAIRVDDYKAHYFKQPYGWMGEKTDVDMPIFYNLRQDPFERTSMFNGETAATGSLLYMRDFYGLCMAQFPKFQDVVGKLAESAIAFPPMQDPASFNLDAVKRKIEAQIKQRGQ